MRFKKFDLLSLIATKHFVEFCLRMRLGIAPESFLLGGM